jgi:hypothetical protein
MLSTRVLVSGGAPSSIQGKNSAPPRRPWIFPVAFRNAAQPPGPRCASTRGSAWSSSCFMWAASVWASAAASPARPAWPEAAREASTWASSGSMRACSASIASSTVVSPGRVTFARSGGQSEVSSAVVDVQLVFEGRPAGAHGGIGGAARLDRGGQAPQVAVEGVVRGVHEREVDLALERTSAGSVIGGHRDSL